MVSALWAATTASADAPAPASAPPPQQAPPQQAPPPQTPPQQLRQVPPRQEHATAEMTRGQAIALLEKRYRARVLRADLADESGRHVYVCRLLSDGSKVWVVRIDAHSGALVP